MDGVWGERLRDDRAPAGTSPAVSSGPRPAVSSGASPVESSGTRPAVSSGTSPVVSDPPRGLPPWSADRESPLYTAASVRPVHNLRYDWTGWLRDGAVFPSALAAAIHQCQAAWQSDGLTLDHWQAVRNRIQILFSADPSLSPALAAGRAKGRLQHALRQAGTPVFFSRRVGFRSLGGNTREIVAHYVAGQVGKSDYIDARFKTYLDQFTVADAHVGLAEPFCSGHGRYWYNLHVVIVVQDRRFPMTRHETFIRVRDASAAIARREGHELAEISVMPDHVHMALRGNIEQSPLDIGLVYLNGLARTVGNNRCWSEEFYVGTFSEYGVDRIMGKQ